MLYQIFGALDWCMSFCRNLWIYIGNVICDLPMHGQNTSPSHGDEIPASSKSRRFANRVKQKSERQALSEDREGISSKQMLMDPREAKIKRKPTFCDRAKQKSKRRALSLDLLSGKSE